MRGKIKTSIMIDEDIWEMFKVKASSKRRLKGMSQAVEEALEKMFSGASPELEVSPVKPRVATSAGKVVSGLRGKRFEGPSGLKRHR